MRNFCRAHVSGSVHARSRPPRRRSYYKPTGRLSAPHSTGWTGQHAVHGRRSACSELGFYRRRGSVSPAPVQSAHAVRPLCGNQRFWGDGAGQGGLVYPRTALGVGPSASASHHRHFTRPGTQRFHLHLLPALLPQVGAGALYL